MKRTPNPAFSGWKFESWPIMEGTEQIGVGMGVHTNASIMLVENVTMKHAKERTAILRLIAASPDLLNAAKNACKWLHDQAGPAASTEIKQLILAIAKAEGTEK